MRVDQLLQDRVVLAKDHVVGEEDRARLALHQAPRRPHRVAQATRRLLLDVRDVDLFAQPVDFGEDLQQVTPVALSQVVLEVDRAVEVVDDGALAAAGHHDHLLDPARDRLLDAVLDGRLVDERQHLFRLRFGDGQEARAETRGREDRLAHRRPCH